MTKHEPGVMAPQPTALERFNRDPDLLANESPLERLRYFLSLALNGQDWIDVEPFLDALGVRADADPTTKGWFAALADARLAARKAGNDWLVGKLDEIHQHLLPAHGVSVGHSKTFSNQSPMEDTSSGKTVGER